MKNLNKGYSSTKIIALVPPFSLSLGRASIVRPILARAVDIIFYRVGTTSLCFKAILLSSSTVMEIVVQNSLRFGLPHRAESIQALSTIFIALLNRGALKYMHSCLLMTISENYNMGCPKSRLQYTIFSRKKYGQLHKGAEMPAKIPFVE